MYGDVALPNRGRDFAFSPSTGTRNQGARVPVSVTVDYEQTYYQPSSRGTPHATTQRFRLVRSAFEDVDGESDRPDSTVKLYRLRTRGAIAMDSPEAVLHETLPNELRDVFFTDGDRALSFIEADAARATKRHRVQGAIRSLLGLGVIEDAIGHVRTSRRGVNKKARTLGSNEELATIVDRLQVIETTRDTRATALADAEEQFRAFDESLSEIERRIGDALRKGNRQRLQQDLERTKGNSRSLDVQARSAAKNHGTLFRDREIATDLVGPRLSRAFRLLNDLHDQGKIPNATIPVLEDRLAAGTCICGEDLRVDDPQAKSRRTHIEGLIDSSRRADNVQKVVTELYFNTKWLQPGARADSGLWLRKYQEVMKRREGIREMREAAGRKQRALELEVASLKDVDIKGLNDTRRDYKRQRDRF